MSLMLDLFLRAMFMIELMAFTSLFFIPLPKKRHFPWRIVSAIIVCLGCALLWEPSWSQNLYLGVFYSIAQFLLLVALTCFCFEATGWIGLYCAIGGIAVQRIVLQISRILVGLQAGFFVEAYLVQMLFNVLALLCGYFLFTKRIQREGFSHMGNKAVLGLCVMFLFGSVVFSSVCSYYRSSMVPAVEYIARLYDLLSCVFALWMERSLVRLVRATEEAAVLQQLWEREKRQMALSRETVDMINMKCHDMKHLLALLAADGGTNHQDEIQRITELINIYDFGVDTENDTLNLVLAEKSLVCQKAGIQLNCMANGSCLSFLQEVDIYSLFGNALDNAIRAVQSLAAEKKKIIKLNVRQIAGMVMIQIENYYAGSIHFSDGLPVTSQDDASIHGYGTRSMRYLAAKYGGQMEITAQEGIFVLNLLIPAK